MPRLRTRSWLEARGRAVLPDDAAALLSAVATEGSLAAAARATGRSYRHAWGLLRKAEEAAGRPLLTRARGGAARGGARLTPAGERVLAAYEQRRGALERVTDEDTFWQAMGYGLSARNQLRGTLRAVERDGVAARVTIDLAPGQALESLITRAAADHLRLREGLRVRAVIKATEVMILAPPRKRPPS
ncbi:MAG TPA: TOBE domain-containing protein [Candidatus Thermoplasmatota archaeon]|nr:TOBE domain-containing protein [Candidatus Thermoplasmatota archaeon]